MLIGVEFPITKENVVKIDAVQLMKAHDYFLYHTQISKGFGNDLKEQYEICRNEIIDRLKEIEKREEQDEYDYWESRNNQDE